MTMKDLRYTQNCTLFLKISRSVRKESGYFYRRQLLTWWITKICFLSITRNFFVPFNVIEFDFPSLLNSVIFLYRIGTRRQSLWHGTRARGRIHTANSLSKVVQQRSTCLALYRGKSIRVRRNGHNLPSSLATTAPVRTWISSTQETPSTRLPNADPGQSVFSRPRSDDGKRTAAIRASGICQGRLSPFWLNWRLSRTGDRLWLSFQRPRSPKLANGHRRETMS